MIKIIASPVTGVVVEVVKQTGESVKADDTVVILESMKMHFQVRAEVDGVVEEIFADQGDMVEESKPLVRVRA